MTTTPVHLNHGPFGELPRAQLILYPWSMGNDAGPDQRALKELAAKYAGSFGYARDPKNDAVLGSCEVQPTADSGA